MNYHSFKIYTYMKRVIFLFLFGCFCFFPFEVEAEDNNGHEGESGKTDLNFGGYGRASAFGGGNEYDFATTFAEFSLKADYKSGFAFLKSDLRLRTGVFFGEEKIIPEVKELYAGVKSPRFDILFGNQIVSRGRVDGFNPTDNLSPIDYFLLSADPDDGRKSQFMLRLNYKPVPGINLEIIGIPFAKMSDYRYDLISLADNVVIGEDILPERSLRNASFSVMANFDFSDFGGSVSFFRGYDPFHGFDIVNVNWLQSGPEIEIASRPYLKNSIGIDMAVPAGSFIFRAEVAYNFTDNRENKIFIPQENLAYVAALETSVAGFTLTGQFIGKYIPDFQQLSIPVMGDQGSESDYLKFAGEMIDYENRLFNRKVFNTQEQSNSAVSMSVQRNFAYDVLSAQLVGYYNFTSEEFMLRPLLTWKVTDAFTASFGGNYMHGVDKSLFSYSSVVLNGAFVEFKVSF